MNFHHMLADSPTATLNLLDWSVIAAYLVLTTLIGARLAGKQSTIRDFFLAGRKIPWWAISGSIIATEISAVTFIAVPLMSARAGGNMTYLQLAIGSIIARIVVAYVFVPRFYQEEIYSPYDYAGRRLGPRVKTATTGLFFVGGVLGQGARVYVTAVLLSVVAGFTVDDRLGGAWQSDIVIAIWVIALFSIGWTLLGGMTTVIWTDVVQFVVMSGGAVFALYCAISAVPDSINKIVSDAQAAGKFQILDTRLNWTLEYTLWCGLLATPFLNIAALGTDQVMAQRMFCSRNQGDARKAVLFSMLGLAIPVIMLLVGIGVGRYFEHHAMSPDQLARYQRQPNSIFPMFIVEAVPRGIRGLIVAAILASAISTLESALAALAQSSVSLLGPAEGRRRGLRALFKNDIHLSKAFVIIWGVVLALMAMGCIPLGQRYKSGVDLALALVAYTLGPLLGIFMLAFLPGRRTDRGLGWAIPLAMLAVFAASVRVLRVGPFGDPNGLPNWDLARVIVMGGCIAAIVLVLFKRPTELGSVAIIVITALAIVGLNHADLGIDEKIDASGQTVSVPRSLAFPWNFPIGAIITFAVGYVLGRPASRGQTAPL